MDKDNITMSRKQIKTFDVISKANDGFITVKEAALALGISERQIQRLKKKVRECGADGVIHGNTGKSPSNRISDETRAEILRIRKLPEYTKSNFLHFTELLERDYSISISRVAVCAILKAEGINSPKTKRRKKLHRRRNRRPQAGLLLQIDATSFAWFSGDRGTYALHGAIDDATSQVTGLYMTKNECLHGYFELFRRTILNYGIPLSAYADRHTIFQSPTTKKHELDPSVTINDTQLGRCLKELSVTLIPAKSPQAKGRIERLWGTLQNRLPIEFMVHKITTPEEANKFLETYIYDFNANFAVEPKNIQNAFRKPGKDENIDYILCIKEKRVIDAGGVFSYGGKSFKIIEGDFPIPAKAKIDVLIGSRFGMMAAYKERVMETLPFVPPKRKKSTAQKKPPRINWQTESPWRLKYDLSQGTYGEREYEREDIYNETVYILEKALLGKYR